MIIPGITHPAIETGSRDFVNAATERDKRNAWPLDTGMKTPPKLRRSYKIRLFVWDYWIDITPWPIDPKAPLDQKAPKVTP